MFKPLNSCSEFLDHFLVFLADCRHAKVFMPYLFDRKLQFYRKIGVKICTRLFSLSTHLVNPIFIEIKRQKSIENDQLLN